MSSEEDNGPEQTWRSLDNCPKLEDGFALEILYASHSVIESRFQQQISSNRVSLRFRTFLEMLY